MNQVKVNDVVYVMDTTPYTIKDDTDASVIYVPEDLFDEYAALNTGLTLTRYNYNTLRITKAPYQTTLEDPIITMESNAPVMTVMYAKGLAANENYMALKEAQAVTNSDIDGLFNGNTAITTFNEFKYFTNVTKVGTSDDAEASKTSAPFRQCTNLSAITLPSSVEELGARAFDLCKNVDVINGLENVTKFNHCSLQATFSSASSMVIDTLFVDKLGGDLQLNNVYKSEYIIKNIVINNEITNIPQGAFMRSRHTESITIPNSVTSIGVLTNNTNGAFNGCQNLKRVNSNVDGIINIPSGVTTIGWQAFNLETTDIFYINEINIPDSVIEIGTQAFAHHKGVNKINIGSGITTINSYAFNDVGALSTAFTMTITATTPPTWDGRLNTVEDITIYVPSESVDEYKAASGWSNYADNITAITQ